MGNECFFSLANLKNGCKPNCQGVYADVVIKSENSTMHYNEKGFEKLFVQYESFKNDYENQWQFSGNFDADISGNLKDLECEYIILTCFT